jgi:hypothetical protein
MDIVDRIRLRFPRPKHAEDGLLANEAADEIERLRMAGYRAEEHFAELFVALRGKQGDDRG